MKTKTFYYSDERNDDFARTVQNIKPLPHDYKYVNDALSERVTGFLVYRIILKPFAWIYTKIRFHHKFVANKQIKRMKTGFLLYGNHTTLLGDVFLPSLIKMRRKNYLIAGEQAGSLTHILPLMRSIGCIPLGNNFAQNREMLRCIQRRLKENASVTVYPEAHVWPYYTGIRPFPAASFKLAATLHAPVVCMTRCFQKKRIGKTPKIVTYLDGPFYPDPALSHKENAEKLRDLVYQTMTERAEKYSTYSVHTYVKCEKQNKSEQTAQTA